MILYIFTFRRSDDLLYSLNVSFWTPQETKSYDIDLANCCTQPKTPMTSTTRGSMWIQKFPNYIVNERLSKPLDTLKIFGLFFF